VSPLPACRLSVEQKTDQSEEEERERGGKEEEEEAEEEAGKRCKSGAGPSRAGTHEGLFF